ncbi:PREDICTED: uncharacterized protein LOC104761210 [Camelina sativa]|uniref:Uncharacterized protein LOC104761210 n=1 Tax=Camelina sativa TaxID=90675 RepID=A0ABM1RAP2_CAMSA|nr:PREDICTED: uncharacterized protein LOC104761210 [Camelina sativa]
MFMISGRCVSSFNVSNCSFYSVSLVPGFICLFVDADVCYSSGYIYFYSIPRVLAPMPQNVSQFIPFTFTLPATIITDREIGRSRCFGFVSFSCEDSANKEIGRSMVGEEENMEGSG